MIKRCLDEEMICGTDLCLMLNLKQSVPCQLFQYQTGMISGI